MNNEITQADRELLAAECPLLALSDKENLSYVPVDAALRAIAAARRQAQAPSGEMHRDFATLNSVAELAEAIANNTTNERDARDPEFRRDIIDCLLRAQQLVAPPSGGEVCETCDGAGHVVTYADPYDRGDVSSPEHSPCPACTAPPSGGEVVAWMRTDPRVIEDAEVGKEPPAMWLMKGWTHVPLYTAPPSAPVGVEEAAREVIESINRFRDAGTRPGEGTLVHWEATLHRALSQQPAAVDGAMVERACKAAIAHFWPDDYDDMDDLRAMMQSALTAALAPFTAAQQPAAVDVACAAVLAEREACARACDDRAAYYHAGDDDGPVTRRGIACKACASVIRWRSTVSPKFLAKHEAGIEERLATQHQEPTT